MSKVIKATFDSTDMAEFAMIRLKREGITVESFEIIPMTHSMGEDKRQFIVFPNNLENGNGPDAYRPEIERLQPFGGILFTSGKNVANEDRTLDDDIHSSDVRMNIKVPDNEAEFAEGILRSCHGYKLRTL